jgi:hypothetical protein
MDTDAKTKILSTRISRIPSGQCKLMVSIFNPMLIEQAFFHLPEILHGTVSNYEALCMLQQNHFHSPNFPVLLTSELHGV